MNHFALLKMAKDLIDFEKSVSNLENHRRYLLEELRKGEQGALREFEAMVVGRRNTVQALKALDLALKNSAASFDRLEKKAAKDEQILAEAKKGGGSSGIDDRHPVLAAQVAAIERLAQKLEFFKVELDKLHETLNYKWQVKNVPELEALRRALSSDFERFGTFDREAAAELKSLRGWAQMHRLS